MIPHLKTTRTLYHCARTGRPVWRLRTYESTPPPRTHSWPNGAALPATAGTSRRTARCSRPPVMRGRHPTEGRRPASRDAATRVRPGLSFDAFNAANSY